MATTETPADVLKRRDAQYAEAIRQIRDTRNYLQSKLETPGVDFETAAALVVGRLSRFLAASQPSFPGDR